MQCRRDVSTTGSRAFRASRSQQAFLQSRRFSHPVYREPVASKSNTWRRPFNGLGFKEHRRKESRASWTTAVAGPLFASRTAFAGRASSPSPSAALRLSVNSRQHDATFSCTTEAGFERK
jgi:hypothetical protein